MGKRQELELEAMRRYAEGMEIPAISVEIGVSENSLRDWRKRAGTEWDDARRAARQSQIASMEDVGSRLRRSREIATQMMGSAKDQSAVGMVLNQTLQTMLYDLMSQIDTTAIDSDDMKNMSKLLGNFSLILGRTEQSASINLKREQEIRKQALNDAADSVEKAAVQQGMNAEQAMFWRQQVLGVQ